MKRAPPAYLSYMLRLWRTNGHWYVSLTDPLTGERIGFADLGRMIAFLRTQIEPDRDHSQSGSGTVQE